MFLKLIAKRYAKARYQFNQLVEAETNELHAKLADRLAKEKRDAAAKFTKEADEMDARIKEVSEMEEKGYWLCENGHEHPDNRADSVWPASGVLCGQCDYRVPMKFIKRDQMTGQEKYESDKERGEAEKIAKEKRQQAEAQEQSAQESDKAAKYFRSLAANNRSVAEKVRRS
jgi:hypothetical protein